MRRPGAARRRGLLRRARRGVLRRVLRGQGVPRLRRRARRGRADRLLPARGRRPGARSSRTPAASYVLADSSKLGAIAVHRVCPLEPRHRGPHRRQTASSRGRRRARRRRLRPVLRCPHHAGRRPTLRRESDAHGSGHHGTPARRRELEQLRLPAAVRPLAAPLRVVRGGVLVHLDHHRDLHHLRLRADHRRHAVDLDLAHRGRRPGARRPGLRRAVGPGPAVRLLLPVGVPAGQRARRLVVRLDVVRVPDHRHRVGRLRPGPGGVPAADRRDVHARPARRWRRSSCWRSRRR